MSSQSTTVAIHDWPALMSDDTLRLYLDCSNDSQWRAMKRRLADAGYTGADNLFKKHVRSEIDKVLNRAMAGDVDAIKREMLAKASS